MQTLTHKNIRNKWIFVEMREEQKEIATLGNVKVKQRWEKSTEGKGSAKIMANLIFVAGLEDCI